MSQIKVFGRRFQEGLFYGIDRVLEPPSIGGRCDEISVETQMVSLHLLLVRWYTMGQWFEHWS